MRAGGNSGFFKFTTMSIQSIKEKISAYHEAGHVVAFLYYGIDFTGVSIGLNEKQQSDARVQYSGAAFSIRGTQGAVPRFALQSEVIISYAGAMAQQKLLRNKTYRGCSDDLQLIKGLVSKYYSPKLRAAMLAYLRIEAKSLFTNEDGTDTPQWGAVVSIAQNLVKKRALTFSDCIELYADAITTEGK